MKFAAAKKAINEMYNNGGKNDPKLIEMRHKLLDEYNAQNAEYQLFLWKKKTLKKIDKMTPLHVYKLETKLKNFDLPKEEQVKAN